MRRGGLLAIVALALGPAVVAAPAHAAVTKSTFSVPVTQPDATGAPVTLDTDVYLPQGTPPSGGWPFVLFFHGGGSNKDNAFDAGHARNFAEHGYATILYSARGHGNSTGQTSVAGPKEMRDTYDVVAWALGIGGRTDPPHPDFHIDRSLMALSGYSQGGLNTNLAQAWSTDPTLDPYDLRFVADEPGNTPDVTFEALVPNDVVKISFGVGLLETYLVGAAGHVDPIVDKWIGTAGADRPELYGAGDECDFAGHDTPGSTMKQDLAARSVGCLVDRMTVPSYWAQAFDDELFPAQMAIHFWQRASTRRTASTSAPGATPRRRRPRRSRPTSSPSRSRSWTTSSRGRRSTFRRSSTGRATPPCAWRRTCRRGR